MLDQLLSGIYFYFIFSLFGIIGLPLILKFRKKTSVTSYLIAKPLGLLLFAFPVWILASNSLKIIKFNNQTTLISLFLVALILCSFLIYLHFKSNKDSQKINWKRTLTQIALIELASLVLLVLYLYVRGFNGALESTEKFMDLHLYMSAGKTDYFPFLDGWMPSETVNYYYYGFYIFTLLNRISGVEYALGYNFCLGLIFVTTVTLSFGIVYKISKSIFFSILGSGFVSLAGNIHYAKCIVDTGLKDISQKCYYARATRIIQPDSYTINEMPSYSFALGDMHPHVMGIPFFLMNLYMVYLYYKSKKPNYALVLALGIGFATSAMINTWDFFVLSFILFLVSLRKLIRVINKVKEDKKLKNLKRKVISVLKSTIPPLTIMFLGVLLFLPFYINFKSPVAGVGFAPAFANDSRNVTKDLQYPSTFGFLFGIWGIYVVFGLVSVLILSIKKLQLENKLKINVFPIYLLFTGIILIIFTELFYFQDLFHITNAYYFRANTVFKLGYLAWIIFGISLASLLSAVWTVISKIKSVKLGIIADFVFVILVGIYSISVFVYPYYAIKQSYGPSMPWNIKKDKFTLDGSKYIQTKNPNDLATIKWINNNLKERVVIVEAVGNAYTYNARIGVNTGMMNPINWPTHEWTWRFHYPEGLQNCKEELNKTINCKSVKECPEIKDPAKETCEILDTWRKILGKSVDTGYAVVGTRVEDVRQIYTSTDQNITKDLLKKYNVKYVYVGKLERTTYPEINENKFKQLGRIVFNFGDSYLYEVTY